MQRVNIRTQVYANAVALVETGEALPTSERPKRPSLGVWVINSLKFPIETLRLARTKSRIENLSNSLPEERTVSSDGTVTAQRSHISIHRAASDNQQASFMAIDIARDSDGEIAEMRRTTLVSPRGFYDEAQRLGYISPENVDRGVYLRDDPEESNLPLGEVMEDLEYVHQQLGIGSAVQA